MLQLTSQYGTVIAASRDLNNFLVVELAVIFVHRYWTVLVLIHLRQSKLSILVRSPTAIMELELHKYVCYAYIYN